jgi:heme exporter protein D
MPDLGKYAGAVLGSYGVTLTLIACLVMISLWQSRRTKRALAKAEKRSGDSVDV